MVQGAGRMPDVEGDTQVARMFIELTGVIARGAETIEVFAELAETCVTLLPVSAAGVLLRDVSGDLQVIGASSPSAHILDLFQVQNDEGPCLECLETGEQVFDISIGSTGRWPRFSDLALQHRFTSVYAFPLRSRRVTVGALNLFATSPLEADRLVVAQALADAATLSLLQIDPKTDNTIVIQRIQRAIEDRNTLDQARGMISQRFEIDPEEASRRLMEVARDLQMTVTSVARAVVHRDGDSPAYHALLDYSLSDE